MHPLVVVEETPYQEFSCQHQVNAYHRASYTTMIVLRSEVSTFRVNEIEARFRQLAKIMLKHALTVNDFNRKVLREGSHNICRILLAEFEDSIAQASVTEI